MLSTCHFAGCAEPKVPGRGFRYCAEHDFGTCSLRGCGRPIYRKRDGVCRRHYETERRHGQFEAPARTHVHEQKCSLEACQSPQAARGWCKKHWQRWRRTGTPYAPPKRDGYINAEGYVIVKRPGHPNASKDGKIALHRLVMSELLGRALHPGENVHHRNLDRLDNRPENLELWLTRQPRGGRVEDVLAWAERIVDTYGNKRPPA